MNFKIEQEHPMRLTGMHKKVSYKNSFQEIPPMWSELKQENIEQYVKHMDHKGIMGICGEFQSETFTYMIGIDTLVDINQYAIDVPSSTWVKFYGTGILPDGIQEIWTQIPDWFQSHPELKRLNLPEIEVYSHPEHQNDDGTMYYEVWIAVQEQSA